jgi:hypothetical protein
MNRMRPVNWAAAASRVAATLVSLAVLLAPALWNRYPLLQYDTGGYLARWYEGYLVPSRSTVFGLFLHAGEGFHFWPNLLVQAALTLWIVALVLRVLGLGGKPWREAALVVGLSLLTALPLLTSALLTDIFAGLGVLSLHLLVFHRASLRSWERIGLFLLTAFAASTHSATLAVQLAIIAAAGLLWLLRRTALPVKGLAQGGSAIATGAVLLLAANFTLSGELAWTPGGYGIVFGRMLQDGIVKRYLDDHCPVAKLRLCPYRDRLPATADEFLWNDGVFDELGRFRGLGEEMRFIVLHSLRDYPLQQADMALAATARQLVLVASGYGMHDQIWHTYGIIERYIPAEVAAMHAARQQHGELDFELINRVHVPVAFASMLLVLALLSRAAAIRRFDDLAAFAATVAVAVLANAFACGALSGPHDRYGARIVWIAVLLAAVAVPWARRVVSGRRIEGVLAS